MRYGWTIEDLRALAARLRVGTLQRVGTGRRRCYILWAPQGKAYAGTGMLGHPCDQRTLVGNTLDEAAEGLHRQARTGLVECWVTLTRQAADAARTTWDLTPCWREGLGCHPRTCTHAAPPPSDTKREEV